MRILKIGIYEPLMLRKTNLEGNDVYDPYLSSSWHIRWETFLGSKSEVLSTIIKQCFNPYQIRFYYLSTIGLCVGILPMFHRKFCRGVTMVISSTCDVYRISKAI